MHTRFITWAVVLASAGAIAVARPIGAQGGKSKAPMTEEDYEEVMEGIEPLFESMRKSLDGPVDTARVAGDAKKIQALLKQAETFWAEHKIADAVEKSKAAAAATANVEKAAASNNAAATVEAIKKMGGACRACHNEYRDKLEDGSYKIKYPAK